jgi:hypothetical protein
MAGLILLMLFWDDLKLSQALLHARVRVLVCPQPPRVFSHEFLGRLRTGFWWFSPLRSACVFLNWEMRPKLKASLA